MAAAAMLTATALPQQFTISGFEEALKPLLDLIALQTSTIVAQTSIIVSLEAKVAALDDSIKKLQDDVVANTTATNNAVAAMGASGVSQAQLDALAKVSTDLEANTLKLATATPPPVVPPGP